PTAPSPLSVTAEAVPEPHAAASCSRSPGFICGPESSSGWSCCAPQVASSLTPRIPPPAPTSTSKVACASSHRHPPRQESDQHGPLRLPVAPHRPCRCLGREHSPHHRRDHGPLRGGERYAPVARRPCRGNQPALTTWIHPGSGARLGPVHGPRRRAAACPGTAPGACDPASGARRAPALPDDTQSLMLSGDYGNAFFESHPYTDVFAQHLFEYWQYIDVYASWHGMASVGTPPELYDPDAEWTQRWFEFGAINLPNPGY